MQVTSTTPNPLQEPTAEDVVRPLNQGVESSAEEESQRTVDVRTDADSFVEPLGPGLNEETTVATASGVCDREATATPPRRVDTLSPTHCPDQEMFAMDAVQTQSPSHSRHSDEEPGASRP